MGTLRRSPIWSDPRVKPPFGAVEVRDGHPLATGLAAAFLVNEAGGNRWFDMTRIQRPGVFNGAPTWVSSLKGPGTQFDGTNDFVDVPHHASLDIIGEVTQSFSVRVLGGSGTSRVGSEKGSDPTATVSFGWGITSGDALADVWLNNYHNISSVAMSLNTWYRVVIVRSGNQLNWTSTYYVNGQRSSVGPDVSTIVANTDSLGIAGRGALVSGLRLNCIIENYAIHSRALNTNEALALTFEPYAFLRPIIRRRYFVPAIAAGGLQWKLTGGRPSLAGRGGLAA